MEIQAYLGEIEHAARQLLAGIWREDHEVSSLAERVTALAAAARAEYGAASAMGIDAETPDDVMQATGRYWDTYFGADKGLDAKSDELEQAQARLALHGFSRAALASALLQFAKQAISLAHGGLQACPDGRPVGTQPIKAVIWQGRNQGIHWEDGHFTRSVDECCERLAHEVDAVFGNYRTRNVSFEVVSILGWRDWDSFRTDLLTLQ